MKPNNLLLVLIFSFVFIFPVNKGLCVSNIFIKVGELVGESIDDQHVGWSYCISFSHDIISASNSSEACFNDVKITKRVDQISPDLNDYAANSTYIPEVKIQFHRAGGENLKYLEVTLKGAFVTSVTTSYDDVTEVLEDVCFTFAEIVWSYIPISAMGEPGKAIERSIKGLERCSECQVQSICGPLVIQ